jgi:hypothetical protein
MITLIKGNYKTPLIFHVKTHDVKVPLVGSRVLFSFVSKETGKRIGGGECKVIDVASGMCKYEWKEGELDDCGEYQGNGLVELAQGATRPAVAIDFVIVEKP